MKDGMHEENKCLLKQMAARLPSGHRRLLGHREIVAEAEMPSIDNLKHVATRCSPGQKAWRSLVLGCSPLLQH